MYLNLTSQKLLRVYNNKKYNQKCSTWQVKTATNNISPKNVHVSNDCISKSDNMHGTLGKKKKKEGGGGDTDTEQLRFLR